MGTGASSGTGSTAVEALQYVERLGRYRILARLGQGGMGTIHLAVAFGLADFRKLLVVKELRPELTCNERFVEMFLAEAKLAARLDHPNIVQTLEAGQDGERYYLAMEFLDGQPLVEILKRVDTADAVPTSLLIQILCEVLAGLHYAHELCDYDETPLHIVHRDVNPQNVFVTYNGHVKLVDFGIAKVVDSEMCTTAGVFKGKFPYAAPEQVSCTGVDRRADVFAVGVMLWEILARKRFAPGQPTTQAIDARLAGAEPRIAAVRPDIDPELAAICDHAMHVDPALRYRTAAEFRSDLLDFLAARSGMNGELTLADLMKRDFASERAAAHRVISSQVRRMLPDEDLPDSLVRVLTRSNTSPELHSSGNTPPRTPVRGHANDTSKLDTSRARPGTPRRSDAPPLAPGESTSFRAQRVQRWRVAKVSAIALLAFVGAYMLVRIKIDDPAFSPFAVANVAPPQAGPPAVTAPTTPTTPTTPSAQPDSDSRSEPDTSRSLIHAAASSASAPHAPEVEEASPAAAKTATLSAGAARGGGRARARELASDNEPRAARPSRGQRRDEPELDEDPPAGVAPVRPRAARALTASRPTRGSGVSAAAAETTTATALPVEVGDDLRSVRGARRPRPLSLEDPF